MAALDGFEAFEVFGVGVASVFGAIGDLFFVGDLRIDIDEFLGVVVGKSVVFGDG